MIFILQILKSKNVRKEMLIKMEIEQCYFPKYSYSAITTISLNVSILLENHDHTIFFVHVRNLLFAAKVQFKMI